MKFFVVLALIATVASATYLKPTSISSGEMAQIQEVIAAIQSPNTDPATAAALMQMLEQLLGTEFEPISVGPAIVDEVEVSPVVVPTPVVDPIAPEAPAAAAVPLVQIILNINQANADSVVAGAPVRPDPSYDGEVAPGAVSVVESAPETVVVAEVVPSPVQVVDIASVPAGVVTPIVTPEVAMPIPEILN